MNATVEFEDKTQAVIAAADLALNGAIATTAAAIATDAADSIQQAEGPSLPGTPPHTHTRRRPRTGKARQRAGSLPRAIAVAQDTSAQTAVIGPRYSMAGESGNAHEFGGEFKGHNYPERRFMGPALERNVNTFGGELAGSIGG